MTCGLSYSVAYYVLCVVKVVECCVCRYVEVRGDEVCCRDVNEDRITVDYGNECCAGVPYSSPGIQLCCNGSFFVTKLPLRSLSASINQSTMSTRPRLLTRLRHGTGHLSTESLTAFKRSTAEVSSVQVVVSRHGSVLYNCDITIADLYSRSLTRCRQPKTFSRLNNDTGLTIQIWWRWDMSINEGRGSDMILTLLGHSIDD